MGAVGLAFAGYLLAVVLVEPSTGGGVEDIAYALVGLVLGLWIGASIGCYVALRLRRHEAAGVTAALLLPILILWWLVLGWVQRSVDLDNLLVGLGGITAGVIVVLMLPAVAARAITMLAHK